MLCRWIGRRLIAACHGIAGGESSADFDYNKDHAMFAFKITIEPNETKLEPVHRV